MAVGFSAHTLYEQIGKPRGRGHRGLHMSKVDWEIEAAAASSQNHTCQPGPSSPIGAWPGAGYAREEGQGVQYFPSMHATTVHFQNFRRDFVNEPLTSGTHLLR